MSTLVGSSQEYRATLQFTMINTSGNTIVAGDVLIADLANAPNGCTTTTVLGDDTVIGIAIVNAEIGGPVEIMAVGIGPVNVSTAITAGDQLITSTTAGKATNTSLLLNPSSTIIGQALTPRVSGKVLAMVNLSGNQAAVANITDFLALTDTPDSYIGSENYGVFVDAFGTGLEFRPDHSISQKITFVSVDTLLTSADRGIILGTATPLNITMPATPSDGDVFHFVAIAGNMTIIPNTGQAMSGGLTSYSGNVVLTPTVQRIAFIWVASFGVWGRFDDGGTIFRYHAAGTFAFADIAYDTSVPPKFYISRTDNNVGNLLTDTNNWLELGGGAAAGGGPGIMVTESQTQATASTTYVTYHTSPPTYLTPSSTFKVRIVFQGQGSGAGVGCDAIVEVLDVNNAVLTNGSINASVTGATVTSITALAASAFTVPLNGLVFFKVSFRNVGTAGTATIYGARVHVE